MTQTIDYFPLVISMSMFMQTMLIIIVQFEFIISYVYLLTNSSISSSACVKVSSLYGILKVIKDGNIPKPERYNMCLGM